jgi:O-antigen ligase
MSGASLSHVFERPRLGALVAAPRWESAVAAVGGAICVGGLAAANGGYFPPAWGWGAIGIAWVAALALVVRPALRFERFDAVLVTAWLAVGAWIWLALLWSTAGWRTVLEGERVLVYVVGVAAALLVLTRASVPALLGGLVAASSLVSAYSLSTRLFPDRIGVFDPVASYRLATPMGYWNGLGIFAVVGTLLALAFSARARATWARALASVLLVVLVPTLYFTFGRGAWLALACGIIAALALAPARLQLASALLFALPAPAIAVFAASRSDALTHSTSRLGAAAHDGHRVALLLVPLAVAAAALAVLRTFLERRSYTQRLRLAYGAALLAVPLVVLVVVFAGYGGPATLAHKAYESFKAPPAYDRTNLNSRLFTLTSNGRLDAWSVASHDARHHLLAGAGPGTFEEFWNRHRPTRLQIRDAHSLYVETLAEQGIVGLALLALALGVPLAAAYRARAHPLAPLCAGAYVAYLVHAAVDWDWELSAVTLVALFCGAALVVLARRHEAEPRTLRLRVRVPAVGVVGAIAAMAFVGLVSNVAIAKSDDDLDAAKYVSAAKEAKRAEAWAPWSPQPWERLGDAAGAAGYEPEARAAYRRALAKDRNDWTLWFDLAAVTHGNARRQAIARAAALNPRDPDVVGLRAGAAR